MILPHTLLQFLYKGKGSYEFSNFKHLNADGEAVVLFPEKQL